MNKQLLLQELSPWKDSVMIKKYHEAKRAAKTPKEEMSADGIDGYIMIKPVIRGFVIGATLGGLAALVSDKDAVLTITNGMAIGTLTDYVQGYSQIIYHRIKYRNK